MKDQHTPWNPCMPQTEILEGVNLTKEERELWLMKLAQTDILVQDAMNGDDEETEGA